jgi:hypothetical protein
MKFYGFDQAPLDGYAFYERPFGKWRWLQRQCFKILRYLGAYRQEMGMTRSEVDYKSLAEAALEHPRQLMKLINSERMAYIIVGYHQAREILHGLNEYEYTEVPSLDDMTTRFYLRGVEYWGVFAGMCIIVVPWFDGMLFLPELGTGRF